MELLRVDPTAAPLIRDLLASNLDWPGAAEISKRFKAMLPPQIQEEENPEVAMVKQQAQQAIQQLQQQAMEISQQLESLKMDKEIDSKKVEIEAYNAETKRLQATQVAMQPEQVQALVMQTIQQLLNSPDVNQQQQMPQMQQIPMHQVRLDVFR